MKLSMWILANQLTFLEPVLSLRPDSPMVLHSARRAYATNCVYVYQDGPDCVCAWEMDAIRLPDISVSEAFEIVQSVFDQMSDWYSKAEALIAAHEFQQLVDLCYPVFKCPMVLLDGSYRVVGISRKFGADDLDEEWRYLKEYGCCSADALRKIRKGRQPFYLAENVVPFVFTDPMLKGGGMTLAILRGEQQLGRMVLLQREHPLNRGDQQLMELLAGLLRAELADVQGTSADSAPYLDKLLEGHVLSESELRQLTAASGWKPEDTYQVFLFSPRSDGRIPEDSAVTRALLLSLYRAFPEDRAAVSGGRPVLLANRSLLAPEKRLESLRGLAERNGLRISFSLPAAGLEYAACLLGQAQAALRYGLTRNPGAAEDDYARCGLDDLIDGRLSGTARELSCQPDVLALWRRAREGDDSLYETLKTYLVQERSVQNTAALLYIHKNTLLYRLRKLKEQLGGDLDDAYTREYMRISFYVLDRRKPER